MTQNEAAHLIFAELYRAQSEHRPFASGHEGYAVIREELDELWDAIKQQKSWARYGGPAGYEAVQVAAMGLRFLVDLCDRESVESFIAGRHGVTK
jgi:hypothetical protein